MSLIYINPYALASTGAASFLDTYPGALAAYSLRSLSSSVTNVVRVVRAITSAISQTFKEGTAEYARINGTDYTRGTTALATTANTSTTLTFGLGDNASFPFVGKASEAFMYLSSQRTNASAIEANINAYYGIFV
jgi:hypothetical protein